jgi:adenylate cyclase
MPSLRIEDAEGLTHDLEASPAYSILIALQRAGIAHRHDCGGKALCGTCRVRLLSGRLSPMGERERQRLAAVGESLDGAVRLACQARPGGALVLRAILGVHEERS